MSIADELQRLEQLRQAGTLTDEEFAKAKDALLHGPPPAAPAVGQAGLAEAGSAARDAQTNQWAMFLHLSLLAGFVVPLGGLVLPIVIWQLKKSELPGTDVHGKIVVNWIISAFLYAVLCGILVFLIIGIPLLIVLGILGVIFPIIGAVKASKGEVWKYPLAISFLR